MFQYIKKTSWFPTSVDFGQAATIEELLQLCKSGEVERVVIPQTYYGYGSAVIDDSNRRSIKRHYSRSRFKDHGYSLTMSASQFLRNEEYRELVEGLQEKYPVFNDQDYSELESEVLGEHLVSELVHTLNDAEDAEEAGLWTAEEVWEIFNDRDGERVEWWEYVTLDTDGATPYATEEDVATLAARLKTLRKK